MLHEALEQLEILLISIGREIELGTFTIVSPSMARSYFFMKRWYAHHETPAALTVSRSARTAI